MHPGPGARSKAAGPVQRPCPPPFAPPSTLVQTFNVTAPRMPPRYAPVSAQDGICRDLMMGARQMARRAGRPARGLAQVPPSEEPPATVTSGSPSRRTCPSRRMISWRKLPPHPSVQRQARPKLVHQSETCTMQKTIPLERGLRLHEGGRGRPVPHARGGFGVSRVAAGQWVSATNKRASPSRSRHSMRDEVVDHPCCRRGVAGASTGGGGAAACPERRPVSSWTFAA